jgi:hypothetical protein
MNLIKNMNEKINILDQRFFLLTEDFIPNYIRYLINPDNIEYTEEINYILDSIHKINSDAFIYMNEMLNEIDKNSVITANLTNKMEILKKENGLMKEKIKLLKRQSLTSEGMFDDQLDWYKDQLTVVIVMLIGVILGTFFLKSLNLNFKQLFISLAIVLIFGFIFTKIALGIVGIWQNVVT